MLQELISSLSFLQPRPDDDFSDRLSYYYTSTFLIVAAILISFKMFAGRPMECWVPAEYTGSWEDYSEIYCWARNTYYVPFDEHIPEDIKEREFQEVSYYQWTPFFLVICALSFYFPCICWRSFYDKSGVLLQDIVSVAGDKLNIQPTTRQSNVQGLAAHLLSVFRHKFRFGSGSKYRHTIACCLNIKDNEAYMTLLYIGIKCLYLANACMHLLIMNRFLQTDDYGLYGVGVVKDLLVGRGWQESGNFPRVTMCDMNIRVLGNVQRHTVQCVLVINIFNEKIFIFLWLWYSLLCVVTLASLLYWVASSILPFRRRKFILRRLEQADMDFNPADFGDELKAFERDWLKVDGVFVLRFVTMHAGVAICTELVDAMWDMFLAARSQLVSPTTAEASVCLEREADAVQPPSAPGEAAMAVGGGRTLDSVDETAPCRAPVKRKNSVFTPLVLADSERRPMLPLPHGRRRFFNRSISVNNEA